MAPYYRILPPLGPSFVELPPSGENNPTTLVIAPGKGFGDGRHETTQLCLLAIGYLLRSRLKPKTMLDFGAGNGILGIAAAKAGARVQAVEIDDEALAEAQFNALHNGVLEQMDFQTVMGNPAPAMDLVVANILRSVLIDYALALSARVARSGYLILSGLVSTDVPSILACYCQLLPEHCHAIYERGAWRAVLFSPRTANP